MGIESTNWRSQKAHDTICEAAEGIANRYCDEDDTYYLEVERLKVAISEAVDRADLPRATADDRDANARAVALIYEFTDNISPLRLYAKEWLINRVTEALAASRTTGETTVEACLAELREVFRQSNPLITIEASDNGLQPVFYELAIYAPPETIKRYGPSLADCMAQVHAATKNKENK